MAKIIWQKVGPVNNVWGDVNGYRNVDSVPIQSLAMPMFGSIPLLTTLLSQFQGSGNDPTLKCAPRW